MEIHNTRETCQTLVEPQPNFCNVCKIYIGPKGCIKCIKHKKCIESIGRVKPKFGFIYNFKYRCTRKIFSNGKWIDEKVLHSLARKSFRRCLSILNRKKPSYAINIVKKCNPYLRNILSEISKQ